MLHAFAIKNFSSIKQTKLELSFQEGKAPNRYQELEEWVFLEEGKKNRLVPCLAMYGANASGKSNIIRALQDFQQIVILGLEACWFPPFVPNKLLPSGDDTSFALSFFRQSKHFEYQIVFNNQEILSETLQVNSHIIFSLNGDKENFSGINQDESYSIERLKKIRKIECLVNSKQVKTYLSRLATQYPGLDDNVYNAYVEIRDIEIYRTNDLHLPYLFRNDPNISPQIINEYLVKITDLLAKLDIGITKLTYDEKNFSSDKDRFSLRKKFGFKDGKVFINSISSYRQDINGKEVEFNLLEEESNGTKILTSLLILCLLVLEKGKIIVIDELDRSLHPTLFVEIVRLFKSKRYNQNKAQLIFTAHESGLLESELLRVSEIALISKTLQKGTTISRIADFDNVRNVLNFRKQYLNGTFGGIPSPYI